MNEIYRTSLPTERLREEIRFILTPSTIFMEIWPSAEHDGKTAPTARLSLPLALWPRFHEAVCCLGAFMKALPAPAYQTMACCSYTCPPTPETTVLEIGPQEQLSLALQDRRGSTFLEIRSVRSPPPGIGEKHLISIGPTLWSAFLTSLQNLAGAIAAL